VNSASVRRRPVSSASLAVILAVSAICELGVVAPTVKA
jgi:hypothetical protein